jgi:hypothetical protein
MKTQIGSDQACFFLPTVYEREISGPQEVAGGAGTEARLERERERERGKGGKKKKTNTQKLSSLLRIIAAPRPPPLPPRGQKQ